MKNLKGRITSMLIVAVMAATGTAPKVFAEVINESPVSEQTSSSSQNDEQTSTGEPVYITGEVEELRTENSKTYEKSDGSRVSVVLDGPIHFYDEENNEWKEYDNRFTYNEDTETYESNEIGCDMKVSLPKNIDEQSNIEVESDGYKVSITPVDMKSSVSKKINDNKKIKSDKVKDLKKYDLEDYVSDSVLDGKVEYNQDNDTSIEYIFSGSKLKENIILKAAPQKNQKYSFRISSNGLTAKLKKDNSVVLVDENKESVFTIPAPYMYDKNYEYSDEIKTTLKKDGSDYILSYAPDKKWLEEENRTFPVTIDPTITTALFTNKIVDTSVVSKIPTDFSNYANLYVGAQSNRVCTMDAYINFTVLPPMENSWIISSAKLNLKTSDNKENKINAYKVTSDWETSTVRSNPPSADSTILDICNVPATENKWVYWDITNTVCDWYNGGNNYGIKLSSPYAMNNQSAFYSADTSNSDDKPYLSIEYRTISSAQLENSRTIDIGRAGTVTINDLSGSVVLSREDIGFDGNVMPVNISMIYDLNSPVVTPYGFAFKTNYSQQVSFQRDIGRNEFYEYYCGDGSKVYFDYDEETGEYIDRSERGYSLKVQGESESEYVNIVITDSNGDEHYFDKYGRLSKIVSTQGTAKSSITIAYTGDYTEIFDIDYIIDGVGRKYDFNYSNGMLTDISYCGHSSSPICKVEYEYDGTDLKKVTYPDGKSISYNWNNHNLVSVYNTDNYHVNFTYTSYNLNKRRKISSIKEYGSSGTKGADISVTYSPFQTKYTNNSGDTETVVFSNDGDLISTYNSDGQVTVNEYAKGSGAHGVNSLVNTFEHKKSEINLIKNGEFINGLTDWSSESNANVSAYSSGHPGNSKSVKISGTPSEGCSISQEISITGEKGDNFDVGGWVKANASPQSTLNIAVAFLNNGNLSSSNTIDFNPYCTNWQYAMKNIQAQGHFTSVLIVLNYSYQINTAYFDGISVYQGERIVEDSSTGTDTDTDTDENVSEPKTYVSSDGSTTTIDEQDGVQTITVEDKYGNNLSNTTAVDGVTLSDSNEYSASGNYMKSSTDSSGVKTSYSYNENSGNLIALNVNNNPINYGYDSMGNITSVLQNVSGLSNGTAIINAYAYDSGDRLSRITHNGFNYYFDYTEFGLLESIKQESNSLINYDYDRDGVLTSASYGNGQTINYDYNADGSNADISQDGNILYSYDYDEDGVLTSVNDNVSNRVTNYLTNDDGQDIIEETGNGIFHRINDTENSKEETIGDETKSYATFSEDSVEKTKYKVNYNYDSTHEKHTDKFGRTSKEDVIVSGKANPGSEVYNKEYSYLSYNSGMTSERVSKITYTGTYDKTISYGYDACGNISSMNKIWYTYDKAGQLIREINISNGTGKEYVYDKGGNITEVKHLEKGEYAETDTYTYGKATWKDLLTAYNGNKITYDEIGNPLTYYNGTEFNWTMGRRLESAKNSIGNISYTYNAEGLRTSKKINGMRFNYYWNGDKLTGQTWNGDTLYFYYDNDGNPIGFDYNDKHYYYLTNLQGDIVAILGSNGSLLAEYEYDAWGNCTILFDTNDIADINPLRYRGYYYDYDTNLYYLQSRYYDANIGRFINADSADMISENELNLFEYCSCNPVMYVDPHGYYKAYIFSNAQFYNESKYIRDSLKRYFKNNLSSNLYKLETAKAFIKKWNAIKSADVIVLNAHADQKQIFDDLTRNKIFNKLCILKCKALIILGCNAGHYNYIWNNVAYNFSLSITGTVVASDGTVYSESTYPYNSKIVREPYFESRNDKTFLKIANNKRSNNWGWVLYRSVYGKKYVTTTWYSTNLYKITMPSILNYLKSCGLVKF